MAKLNIPRKVIDLLLCPELRRMPSALREDFVSCVTFSFIEIAEQAGHEVDYEDVSVRVQLLYHETFRIQPPESMAIH